MTETGCKNAFLVTRDERSEEKEYETGAGTVQAVSALEWFSMQAESDST
jgi:hypothetical protein